jgi:predicted ATP-dependent serine protease
MKTLFRSIGRPDIGGEPLPAVFKTFENAKIILRRAEVSLVAGTPGAGKSTLALSLALRMGVPTLYVSADTNAHTMAMRLLSMVTGKSQTESEEMLQDLPKEARSHLEVTDHIYWSFEPCPSLDDLDQEVLAFEEIWGTSPSLIIVDNLMDLTMDGAEEFSGMRAAMKELKYLARDTNAAVLVLHHTKESIPGNPCQPRSAVQGMVNQLPALICTIGQDSNGYLAVSPVKNRYGKASPMADDRYFLSFNPEYMYLSDIEEGS